MALASQAETGDRVAGLGQFEGPKSREDAFDGLTASSFPAGSARGGWKGSSPLSAIAASIRSRISGFATACSSHCGIRAERAQDEGSEHDRDRPKDEISGHRHPAGAEKADGGKKLRRHDAARRMSRSAPKKDDCGTAYGATKISERHRHRYEVNPVYVEAP